MLDFSNVNSLWASVLVETLVRLGLETAVICPGSRSTPLTVAFARHPLIQSLPILDERSAAFFALGRAKRLDQPVVLVCTSGTAAANFFPAIIEAKESQVPLLVLTGDRPWELRHCHSGQTIDQVKLYGSYPQWQSELALPRVDLLYYLRQTLVYAWEQTQFPRAGVVHLNCPFADPLAPVPDGIISSLEASFPFSNFFRHLGPSPRVSASLLDPLPNLPSGGLIIAGLYQGGDPQGYCQAIATLARGLKYPVLSDALSPLRNFIDLGLEPITGYDFILRSPTVGEELTPSCILQIGDLPTSKQLRTWLFDLGTPRYILDSSGENFDPVHGSTLPLRCSLESLIAELEPEFSTERMDDYGDRWRCYEAKTQAIVAETLENQEILTESNSIPLLCHCLPAATLLMIANSMPVRYLEYFWPCNQKRHLPYFNRGANGIDGTLSTALGIAHTDQPTVLITGDLSLLHDTNGFLISNIFQGGLTIILFNNHGGGIFEHLAIAEFADVFEDYFATPQSVHFVQLCATYGVDYQLMITKSDLIQSLALEPPQGIRLLEINGDRRGEAQWLQGLMQKFTEL